MKDIRITVPVRIELEPKELDMVIASLERLPYNVIAPLMAKIRDQVIAQLPQKDDEL